MKPLVFSPGAAEDIDLIWDYTADRWGIGQAERYVLDLRDTCNALSRGDLSGRDGSAIRPGYRKQNCGSHVIFYRESAIEIVIVRILHQRMDFDRHL